MSTEALISVDGAQADFAPVPGPWYRKRVEWDDFVDVAGSGVVAGFLTLPADTVIVKVQWRIVEAFTDSSAGSLDLNLNAGSPPDNTLCDASITPASAGFPSADLIGLPVSGVDVNRYLLVSEGATLDAVIPGWMNDGDAGIADLYIVLGTVVDL